MTRKKGGKEERREGGKEGRKEGGKEGRQEGRREGGKEGRRKGGKEERREGRKDHVCSIVQLRPPAPPRSLLSFFRIPLLPALLPFFHKHHFLGFIFIFSFFKFQNIHACTPPVRSYF